ncbi:MAG: hypothetical protein HYR84_16675 [Planctomycetes bacterium]|nr:hypothetical protein [Planctomycetota bacterium]
MRRADSASGEFANRELYLDMDFTHFLGLVFLYGPTPLAAILAGWQAQQCSSPWQAFVVALLGTVALAVVFGVAVDYLSVWGVAATAGKMWQLHLMIAPLAGLPVAVYCGVVVQQRSAPPEEMRVD